jgi:hypothetical protein
VNGPHHLESFPIFGRPSVLPNKTAIKLRSKLQAELNPGHTFMNARLRMVRTKFANTLKARISLVKSNRQLPGLSVFVPRTREETPRIVSTPGRVSLGRLIDITMPDVCSGQRRETTLARYVLFPFVGRKNKRTQTGLHGTVNAQLAPRARFATGKISRVDERTEST